MVPSIYDLISRDSYKVWIRHLTYSAHHQYVLDPPIPIKYSQSLSDQKLDRKKPDLEKFPVFIIHIL